MIRYLAPLSALSLVFSVISITSSCAQNTDFPESQLAFTLDTISTDFKTPWSFCFLPDGDLLVTEKEGELFLLREGIKTLIAGMPEIYVRGQGGLLDVVTHPDYAKNHLIYFSHGSSSSSELGGNTTVTRGKLEGSTLSNVEVIFKATPESKKGPHWGGRLQFDNDGLLYVSVGDRGDRDVNPQSLNNHSGKIHRIKDDGTIPNDNPFVGQDEAIASIYSYGHRNPQGLTLDPETGDLWEHEHGPKGGDELNLIRSGKNYGWPDITYGINYDGTIITEEKTREGMEQPINFWLPSIAPCGMAYVSGDKYPEWTGSVLVGSLKFQYIHRCKLDEGKVIHHEKILQDFGRFRSIKQSPDGYIYFSVEGKGIFKIIPAE